MPTKYLAVPYLNVGKHIRVWSVHRTNLKVAVGGSATVMDDSIGDLLRALNDEEDIPIALGLPPNWRQWYAQPVKNTG